MKFFFWYGKWAYTNFASFIFFLFLNSGIYPSEVCPYELQCPFSSTEDLQPQSLYAKIKTACGSLRGGYPRIINLCRCVSQVLQ